MNKFVLVSIAVLLNISMFAQEDEESCRTVDNKKVKKLLEQSKDPKLPRKEQNLLLKEALTIDESCAPCLFQLGKNAYDNAREDNLTPTSAIEYFKKLLATCPDYHADVYYYMGVIYYGEEEFEQALVYFNQFLEFKVKSDDQMSEDHHVKKKDVKEIIPEIQFYATFFKNPVPFYPAPVENVSTQWDEYLPMISPDNELMFFTRRLDKKALGDLTSRVVEEFTMAQRKDISSPFDIGNRLPAPFNVIGDNYGGATISVDNKEMIICSCRKNNKRKPDYNNCDLFATKYERFQNDKGMWEYKWGELVELGPNINSIDSWEAQPSLSADGKTLFFARVMNDGGKPQSDIWYSTRSANGNWTPAKPLVDINTGGHEKAPFMHSDSKTLYFAANIDESHWGAGGYDIFFTRQMPDGKWSKPQNIGYPINSEGDEHGLIVSTDGKLAYYASNKLKGAKGFDIFRFELPAYARPEKVVIVKGQVTDEVGEPVAGAKVEIKYNDGKKEEVKVDPSDGKYAAVVNMEKAQDAVITVKAEDRTYDTKLIAANTNSPVIKGVDMKAEKLEVGKAYTIADILFATNSYELNATSRFVIDQFAEFLKENPNIKIAIHGHTDDRGNPAENLTLSDNRAKAVMNYLVTKGIAANRVSAQGFGQTKPKVSNTSDYNRSLNRRTEFVILSK